MGPRSLELQNYGDRKEMVFYSRRIVAHHSASK